MSEDKLIVEIKERLEELDYGPVSHAPLIKAMIKGDLNVLFGSHAFSFRSDDGINFRAEKPIHYERMGSAEHDFTRYRRDE